MPQPNTAMKAAVKAGIFYFILIFAAGYVLDQIRIRLIIPNSNPTIGLAVELPIILALAWVVCGWLVRRLRVPTQVAPRLAMGAIALVLMLLAEAAVAVIGLHQPLEQHIAGYQSVSAMIGLAARIGFAAMPLLRLKFIARP